jgi:hypothetical protein
MKVFMDMLLIVLDNDMSISNQLNIQEQANARKKSFLKRAAVAVTYMACIAATNGLSCCSL